MLKNRENPDEVVATEEPTPLQRCLLSPCPSSIPALKRAFNFIQGTNDASAPRAAVIGIIDYPGGRAGAPSRRIMMSPAVPSRFGSRNFEGMADS